MVADSARRFHFCRVSPGRRPCIFWRVVLQEASMSFAPIQKEVDEWISQFEEGYFAPLPMLARLTERL